MNDYQKNITVNRPAAEVYAAITQHIDLWWSDDLNGTTAQPGDEYNIAFGKTRKTFKVLEAVPNQRVVWQCTKAYIDMATLQNKAEWVGTQMIWKITSTDDQTTTLNFLHEGLNQSLECYDVCENGWDYFIGSLQAFLTTGTGTPYHKHKVA